MRRGHYVRDNNATDYPQQCIWFDTETRFEVLKDTTTYHHLKFGYACYMRRQRNGVWSDEAWLRFTTRTEFWDWCCNFVREKTKLYLFCHNTSYDLPVLDAFKELPIRGYVTKTAIIDAPPTICRFRSGAKCIMILDTLNIWRMSAKYLGAEIGTEKLEMPADNELTIEWETYARRDVEIIRDACIKWWEWLERNDYGSFAPTLAGQSMRLFRHKYMKHKIYIDVNKGALDLTREGYHGARTECFRVGKFKGSFTLLDVNSMYPSVMAYHQYPTKLVAHTHYANLHDLANWINLYCVTARVLLRTHLPFAAIKSGGKLIFPIGEFECVLNTPELKYAFEHVEILQVKEAAVYDKAYLFTTMMTELYQKRVQASQRGDRVEAFLYRMIMNSFYGKWGQQGGVWIEDDNITDLSAKRWIEYDMVTKKVIRHRQLGGLVQHKSEERESTESLPVIAGHVTAEARMELWRIIQLAGPENVFYCDTDSVLVNPTGRKRLEFMIAADVLGKLSIKLECDDIEIWSAKDFRFGPMKKTKGVRKDAIWIDEHTVQQTMWCGLRGLVSAGIVDKPITKTIQKKLSRVYDKGTVLADGTVQPIFLSATSLPAA